MNLQPKDIEKYCDKKEWRNYDEDGFTGEYVVSAKNIIDMLIDLKALNEPTTRADTSKANLNIPDVSGMYSAEKVLEMLETVNDIEDAKDLFRENWIE